MRILGRIIAIGAVAMVTPIAANAGGPSESEIVQACLAEGRRGVNSAGMNRDAFCQCTAAEARSTLSASGIRVLVLEMEGNRREARTISAKLNESERRALVDRTLAIVEKCSAGSTGTSASAGGVTRNAGSGTASGRYRAENAGESITLDFRDSENVRVTLADQRAVLESAEGRYEVRGDRITVRVPGGAPLVLMRHGDTLEGEMDGQKIRFIRN